MSHVFSISVFFSLEWSREGLNVEHALTSHGHTQTHARGHTTDDEDISSGGICVPTSQNKRTERV